VAKGHGASVNDDKQYEGLRKKGISESRAAAISNSPGASSGGGKNAGSGDSSSRSAKSSGSSGGGNHADLLHTGIRAQLESETALRAADLVGLLHHMDRHPDRLRSVRKRAQTPGGSTRARRLRT
jgi:hypothetical protein